MPQLTSECKCDKTQERCFRSKLKLFQLNQR